MNRVFFRILLCIGAYALYPCCALEVATANNCELPAVYGMLMGPGRQGCGCWPHRACPCRPSAGHQRPICLPLSPSGGHLLSLGIKLSMNKTDFPYASPFGFLEMLPVPPGTAFGVWWTERDDVQKRNLFTHGKYCFNDYILNWVSHLNISVFCKYQGYVQSDQSFGLIVHVRKDSGKSCMW